MKQADCQVVPYHDDLAKDLLSLEQGIIQGKAIQLEIVKDHFLSRASVFPERFACVAVTESKEVIGSAIAAKVKLGVNHDLFDAGFGFDTKVHPAWRGRGVGKMMAQELYKRFFKPQELSRNFMTAKLSNTTVLKLVARTVRQTWLYDFMYLSIPTSNRLKQNHMTAGTNLQLNVKLFDNSDLSSGLSTKMDNGLAYFHTFKLYRLKLKKLNWVYRKSLAVLKNINPAKYAALPVENETFSFATLYDHSPENIGSINDVLEELRERGIGQLLVCCRKNDCIHKTLRSISINQYEYFLVSDFKLEKNDTISIDVRCL